MTGVARLKRGLLLALFWFVVICLVVFLFRSPDLASALVSKALDGLAGAVDAGARFLEGIARG